MGGKGWQIYHSYQRPTDTPFTSKGRRATKYGEPCSVTGRHLQLCAGPSLSYLVASQIQVPAGPKVALHFAKTQSQLGSESVYCFSLLSTLSSESGNEWMIGTCGSQFTSKRTVSLTRHMWFGEQSTSQLRASGSQRALASPLISHSTYFLICKRDTASQGCCEVQQTRYLQQWLVNAEEVSANISCCYYYYNSLVLKPSATLFHQENNKNPSSQDPLQPIFPLPPYISLPSRINIHSKHNVFW